MFERENLFSEADMSADISIAGSMLSIDTTQSYVTNKHLSNALESDNSPRPPSSPLRASNPLVEVRTANRVTVHAGNTPLRSRSNSHSSLSGVDNDCIPVDLTKVSAELNVIKIELDKGESSTSITQEFAIKQGAISTSQGYPPPPSPLPQHLNPHLHGSSSGLRSKVNASPHSPSKRQFKADTKPKTPTKATELKSPKKTAVSNTFASPVDIQSCANAVCIVPLEEADEVGAMVLVAAADGIVRLINAVSGRVIRSYEGLSDRTLCVAVSHPLPCPPEETKASLGHPRILAAGSRGGLCIWDYHSGAQLHVVETEVCIWGVTIVAPHVVVNSTPDELSPSDKLSSQQSKDATYMFVLGASSDGQVYAWRSDTGELLKSFEVHEDAVLCIASYTSPIEHNPVIITGGADALVHLWDYPSGNAHHILSGHSDDVTAVSLVAEEDMTVRAVSGSRDRSIRVWDVKTGHCMAELTGHSDSVCGVAGIVTSLFPSYGPATNPDGMLIERKTDSLDDDKASNSSGGDIESIGTSETSDGDGVARLTAPHGRKHFALSSSRGNDSNMLIVSSCGADGTVCLWDVYQGKQLVTSRLHKECVKGITAGPVTIKTPKGIISTVMLASCSWDKNVVFYQLNTMLKGKGGENCRCVVS